MRVKLITTGLAMALSTAAMAEPGPGNRIIERLDTNGDALISVDEFQLPERRGPLSRADLNDDGMVTIEELRARHDERSARFEERLAEKRIERDAHFDEMLTRMDRNTDGVVSEEEARLSAFEHMDANGDGYLSPSEMRPPKGKRGPRGDKRKPRRDRQS